MDSGLQLQIVVIERPIDTWNDPLTAAIFHKMVSLKLDGYSQHHVYGTLPVDKTDFFADHIVVGNIASGTFEPITGWRSVSMDACRTFCHEFSGLAVAKSAPEHFESISRLIRQYEGRKIRYCSAYTINPQIRDRRLLVQIKPIITALGCLFHTTYQTELSLMAGSVKTKVDKMFEQGGYVPISLEGRELPSFGIQSLNDMEVRMVVLREWSQYARECADRYNDLWSRRMTLRKAVSDARTTVRTTNYGQLALQP